MTAQIWPHGNRELSVEGSDHPNDHGSKDWCHVCGEREEQTADVFYPENAEHDLIKSADKNLTLVERMMAARGAGNTKYIRICKECAEYIALAAAGKVDIRVDDPAEGPLHDALPEEP